MCMCMCVCDHAGMGTQLKISFWLSYTMYSYTCTFLITQIKQTTLQMVPGSVKCLQVIIYAKILTVILIWWFGDRIKIAKLTYAIIDPFILQAWIFKPSACRPKASEHLVSYNYFCPWISVCLCVSPPPRLWITSGVI